MHLKCGKTTWKAWNLKLHEMYDISVHGKRPQQSTYRFQLVNSFRSFSIILVVVRCALSLHLYFQWLFFFFFFQQQAQALSLPLSLSHTVSSHFSFWFRLFFLPITFYFSLFIYSCRELLILRMNRLVTRENVKRLLLWVPSKIVGKMWASNINENEINRVYKHWHYWVEVVHKIFVFCRDDESGGDRERGN